MDAFVSVAKCAARLTVPSPASSGATRSKTIKPRRLVLARSTRCDIERLLDQETLSLLGNGRTCEWSADSLAVLVLYDDANDGYLTAARRNVTLAAG